MATESKKVRRDAFVKNVRPDPKSTEDLVLLQGYIGDSDLAGHVRVYSDPALSDFIELPEQDILYCVPIEPAEDPLGGSRLWVKKTTVFTAGDPRLVNRVKSSFLEGDIVRAFSDAGTIPSVVLAVREKPSVPTNCPVVSFAIECPVFSLGTPACDVTFLAVTCLKTCNQPTIAKPTCFKTCNQPSCFKTCQPSCLQTVDQPSCNQTCMQPTCFQTCTDRPSCFRTCGVVCTATPVCPTITVQTIDRNQGAAPAGYAGGFNPYDTSNYGY